MAGWRCGLPKPRHPCPWDVNAVAVLDSGNVNRDRLAFGALIAATCPRRRSHPAQSYPQTLIVAVGLSLRILYLIVTDVRVASCPGASFAAVCSSRLHGSDIRDGSSLRLFQWRTTFVISTSAPSTESFAFLMSSFHIFPSSALISVLGSVALIVFSLSTNHLSLALAVPRATASKTTDARPKPP